MTRDADFEVSDEADDLLEAVQLELRRRRFGDVVRVEVAESVAPELLDRLKRGLHVEDDQVYLVPGRSTWPTRCSSPSSTGPT